MATTTVLIADEDEATARDLASRVASEWWETPVAVGMDRAVAALASRPVDVLLADARLWHDGGLGAHVSSTHPALPVVVVTDAAATPASLVQHLQLGAMSYVPRGSGRRRLAETIGSILHITRRNPHREHVRSMLRSGEIEFQLGNDPGTVAVLVGYLQRLLEDYELSGEKDIYRVGVALTEALSNAMIHGNLEVDSSLRDGAGDAYYEAIDRQRRTEPFASRVVLLEVSFSRSSVSFVVRDQGPGFDPGALPDPTDPANLARPSGRGILLMRAYTDLVSWNEKGNEVTLVKSLTA